MGAGGEYASAISFVYEHSPARDTGSRNVAQLVATTFVGIMTGTDARTCRLGRDEQRGLQQPTAGAYCSSSPSRSRSFSFYLRVPSERKRRSSSSCASRACREDRCPRTSPVRATLRYQQWPAMTGAPWSATASYALISTTITSYLTTFLIESNRLFPPNEAYNATILSNVAFIIEDHRDRCMLRPYRLRDVPHDRRWRRHRAPCRHSHWPHRVCAEASSSVLIGACKGLLALPALLTLSTIFSLALRVTAVALAYNVAHSLLGSTEPFMEYGSTTY